MSFPRYESYKDSGIDWLHEMPLDWTVSRVGFVADILAGYPFDASLFDFDGIPVIRMSEFGQGSVRPEDAKRIGASLVPEKSLAKQGDILLGLSGSISNFAIVRNSDLPIAINQRVAMVRSASHHSFLTWFLQSREFVGQLIRDLPETTIQNISMGQLRQCRLPVPPPSEASEISYFLDRETAKVDTLIQEQQQLIELLKEKRQAVISYAVTKGLDPSVPMKDSGVDWLGEVPAHWKIQKFSRLVAIAEGQVDPRVEPYASMPLIAPNHVEAGTGRLLALETASEQGADSGKYMFRAGSVIYSKIRPALAKATIAPLDGLCSADMYPLNSKGELNHDFLLYLLLTPGFTAWATLASDRVAMPKINREKLNELQLPVPPQVEQEAITRCLTKNVSVLDNSLAVADEAITLLEERRSALISAAVTGKIDVRGLAQSEAA